MYNNIGDLDYLVLVWMLRVFKVRKRIYRSLGYGKVVTGSLDLLKMGCTGPADRLLQKDRTWDQMLKCIVPTDKNCHKLNSIYYSFWLDLSYQLLNRCS